MRSSGFKGAESDPDVSSATEFPDLPDVLQGKDLPDTGGVEGKAVRDEVARVMENPEINGQPVALDFSSKGKTKGCANFHSFSFISHVSMFSRTSHSTSNMCDIVLKTPHSLIKVLTKKKGL
jgi:hypothetical protein